MGRDTQDNGATSPDGDATRQAAAPLAEAVFRYATEATLRLHFPGHKGRSLSRDTDRLLGRALAHDVTELPGLDDLFAPSGPIEEAQVLAARAFGSARAFFLVGGASAGVVGVLCSILDEGDALTLARTSHRSAVSALVLSGATPLWARGRFIPPCYVPEPVGLGELLAGPHRGLPDCALITSPTYEGLLAGPVVLTGSDDPVPSAAGRPIMVVDEAHGPHMYFLEPQPGKPGDVPERVPGQTPAAAGGPSWNSCLALKQDIDACVHGAHKTLGSLTGTGLLHLKGNRLDPGRVNQALLAVQTSSPSYLMMASLDLARRDMALNGRRWLGEAVAEAEEAREGLRSAGIEFCCPDRPFDPTRLVIGSPQFGLTGRGLSAALRAGGVQAEQAGLLYVLLVFSVGDSPGSGRRLVEALTRIQMAQRSGQSTDHRAGVRARAGARPAQAPPATDVARATSAAQTLAGMDLPSRGLTPRRAWMAAWREVPLAESVGRVAAESIFLYPPGAPLLVAGEIVPLEMPGLVRELCLLGADFQGPADLSMARLRVVEG